jgi:L-lactate dehydrogenase complex protein LldG
MSAAREEVLARVRSALADVPAGEDALPEVERGYRDPEWAPGGDVAARFAERAREYRALVLETGADGVAAAVGEALAGRGATRALAPPGLPAEWWPEAVERVEDDGALTPAELDAVGAVVTGCALAIAATGSLVLDHGPGQGRRALSLVPDVHVCVLRADAVVGGVPEAFARLHEGVLAGRPLTFISGPSATSDIELSRIEGVHGPRTLAIVLLS